jgi:pimeloyl-ACP methyl ester carboxylesterase
MLSNVLHFARTKQVLETLLLRGVPFWQRSRGRRVARMVVLACYIYVATFLVVMTMEDRLLFPAATIARSWCEPPDYLRVREINFDSAAGDNIHAWFTAPEGWAPRQGAVLYSHGNGSNLSRLSGRTFRWRESLGRAVLIYDYPGYGKSSSRPSEAGCYAAGDAALQWLKDDQGVPVNEVVLIGESMGGAIAVELATRCTARLLILEGAFTSFPDMAQFRFPFYPSRYFVHSQMNNEEKIGRAQCPVLIAHGTADDVVPFEQGERLFAAAHAPKQFVRRDGHGHPPPNEKEFFETVRVFLSSTAR